MVQASQTMRRYYIDWLRVLAVLLLVPFHSSLIFVLDPGSIMYIKDTINSDFLDRMAGFIHQFHMPLLFTLAGASACLALGFRSGWQYLGERTKRLLVPAVFGVVVLMPLTTYITRISRREALPFLTHIQGFFILNVDDLAGYYGTLTPGHIWFIIFLFVFSLVGLPIFLLMKSVKCQSFVQSIARFFTMRFMLFLAAIPIALAASLNILGDKNPLVYLLFFFMGFLILTDESYQKAIDRDYPYALIIGIIFEVLRQTQSVHYQYWSLPWIMYGLMECFNRWLWVLVFLGIGHRFLNSGGRILSYLSEAAFPFYIMHLFIDTLVGYFVIRLEIGVALKYIVIVLITTTLVFIIYEGLRRINIMRFLLGMKRVKPGFKVQDGKAS